MPSTITEDIQQSVDSDLTTPWTPADSPAPAAAASRPVKMKQATHDPRVRWGTLGGLLISMLALLWRGRRRRKNERRRKQDAIAQAIALRAIAVRAWPALAMAHAWLGRRRRS